jgi:hypothetical protein
MVKGRLLVLGLLLIFPAWAAAEPKVTINKAPPNVRTRYFDPANRPADMPPLTGDEAALCSYNLGAAASVAYNLRESSDHSVCEAEYTDMTVNLTCDITIWLPNNWTKKLQAHEEGHRRITERAYANSDELARKLAQEAMTRPLKIDRGNCQASADKAANEAAQAVCKQWIDTIANRAGKVNAEFDRITDHARNKIDEDEAIEQAFRRVDRK